MWLYTNVKTFPLTTPHSTFKKWSLLSSLLCRGTAMSAFNSNRDSSPRSFYLPPECQESRRVLVHSAMQTSCLAGRRLNIKEGDATAVAKSTAGHSEPTNIKTRDGIMRSGRGWFYGCWGTCSPLRFVDCLEKVDVVS